MYNVRYPCQVLTKRGNFLDRFSRNIQISKFMKIGPVGAKLFHAYRRMDKQRDIRQLISAFRNFRQRLKNKWFSAKGSSEGKELIFFKERKVITSRQREIFKPVKVNTDNRRTGYWVLESHFHYHC